MPHRADAQPRLALERCFPPYLVLLRVGFTLPPALQPERCALTAPFHPYPGADWPPGEPAAGRSGGPPEGGVAEAVSFLWHWPSMGFEAHVPDVIRHTALRSSDFPPPAARLREAPGSDRPVLLPAPSVPRLQSVRWRLHPPESQSFESVSHSSAIQSLRRQTKLSASNPGRLPLHGHSNTLHYKENSMKIVAIVARIFLRWCFWFSA